MDEWTVLYSKILLLSLPLSFFIWRSTHLKSGGKCRHQIEWKMYIGRVFSSSFYGAPKCIWFYSILTTVLSYDRCLVPTHFHIGNFGTECATVMSKWASELIFHLPLPPSDPKNFSIHKFWWTLDSKSQLHSLSAVGANLFRLLFHNFILFPWRNSADSWIRIYAKYCNNLYAAAWPVHTLYTHP